MRLGTDRVGGLFGERPIVVDTVLVLTEAERKTLRKASQIAERAREKLRERFGEVEAEGFDLDTELAGIEHGCAELVDREKIPVR